MYMRRGVTHRAFCAFFGLILCTAPVFAQRTGSRSAQRTRAPHPQYATNRYIVFLQDAPVLATVGSHDQLQTVSANAYRQQLESRQQVMIRELENRNIKVAGSVSVVMNAIFVVATADRVAEMRAMSGVAGVMPERRATLSINKATSLSNAPAAWAQTAIGGQSNAGNGIKIAILDTGIDQTHPAFNDSGFTLPSGFPKCNAQSDCTNYTNKKVIVARSYVPMLSAGSNSANPSADSNPDDYSARDRDGHGTAVASIAAGVQHTAPNPAVAFSGMAPRAYLGSYKIFGSPGLNDSSSESVMIKAVNDAVSDGMNVISLSSGVPALTGALDDVQCGNTAGVPCDPLGKAFETAAKSGVVIAVSAGNKGSDAYWNYNETYPGYQSMTSPATAPSVIAVGATINSHVFNPSVTITAAGAPANLKNIVAVMSDYYCCSIYPSAYGANTGTLVDVTSTGDDGHACSALPAGSLKGNYVLIQRGPTNCSFDTKMANAMDAGAIGVILYMADSTAPIAAEGSGTFLGPVVMVSLADGQNLKSYIASHPGAPVTIDNAGTEQAVSGIVNSLASYSSFGPSPDGLIKPDMVAPGGYDFFQFPDPNDTYLPAPSGMYIAGQNYDPNGALFTQNRYAAADGTSLAAPLVAGAAALVKQAHPTWTPAQIKSALVNNSAQDVTADDFGDAVDVEWMGAGRLDANAAVLTTVTAEPSTLSFGFLKSGVALPKPIAVTVSNKGAASVTLAVAVAPVSSTASTTVTVDQKTLTIAAGATATLNVSLTGSVPAGGEYSGMVNLTSTSPAVSLHVPYMFLVGDATGPNVVPLYGTGYYGSVGQDLGPIPIQVIDSHGAPVVGTNVVFSVSPRGAVTLKPVPGVAGGTSFGVPSFVPSNCTPASSATTVTCTTNSYGVAWVEVVGGANPYDFVNNPATISAVTNGQTITIDAGLIPVPALTQITDAGAFGPTIAPGSYVSLFGTNLVDPDYLVTATGDSADATFSNGRLPLTWDGAAVSFDAAATGSLPAVSVPGYVYYVSPTQVNVYAPWELTNYTSAQVKVTLSGVVRSNVMTVPVANYAPAFLMYNSGSVFIADAVDGTCPAPYIIGTTCGAARGNLVQFYVNGLGPTTNQPASGDTAPSDLAHLAQTTTTPVVMIGGQQAQVQFAGLAPGFVGLYQVNAYIPTNISTGNQPITIAIGGKTSPTSITGGGTTYNIVLPIK